MPSAQAPFGETQALFSQFEIAFVTHAEVRSEGNEQRIRAMHVHSLPHGELVVRVKNCAFSACASCADCRRVVFVTVGAERAKVARQTTKARADRVENMIRR